MTAEQSRAARDPIVGQVVDEVFTVEAVIGEGAMGMIYRARQLDVDRLVALKVLRPELVGVGEAGERFHREAKLASRIQSPHIAHVYRTGQLPAGNAYLALEFLDGRNLEQLVRAEGALAPSRAVHVMRQAGEAVAEAHEAGIIHRDLKPENVMLVKVGEDEDFVKLLDFGIAKQLDSGAVALTGAGLAIGTPLYISPEAATGGDIGTAADVYALGVMLYEALCGETPFDGEKAGEVLMQHAATPPPKLTERSGGRDVPAALAGFVHRCLAKDPAERPKDGRAFVAGLDEAWFAGALVAEAAPAEAAAPPVLVEERPTVAPGSMRRLRRRRPARWRWIFLALVIAIGGALGARQVLDDMRVRDMQRRAEKAWRADDLDGPGGAIALSDLVLTARPDYGPAKRLRKRMAERLLRQARDDERAGNNADALEKLAMVERLRPDDAHVAAERARLEAVVPEEERPDTPERRALPRVASVTCSPASPAAGAAVRFTASVRNVRGRVEEPKFTIRAMWRGMRFRSVTLPAEARGRGTFGASFAFPTKGRYQVTFTGQTRERALTKAVAVSVSTGAAEPERPPEEPVAPTKAPPPGEGEPAAGAAPDDEGRAGAAPGPAAPPVPTEDPAPPSVSPPTAPAPGP